MYQAVSIELFKAMSAIFHAHWHTVHGLTVTNTNFTYTPYKKKWYCYSCICALYYLCNLHINEMGHWWHCVNYDELYKIQMHIPESYF